MPAKATQRTYPPFGTPMSHRSVTGPAHRPGPSGATAVSASKGESTRRSLRGAARLLPDRVGGAVSNRVEMMKRDRGRGGDVQRVHLVAHRDADPAVGGGQCGVAQTGALGTQQHGERTL